MGEASSGETSAPSLSLSHPSTAASWAGGSSGLQGPASAATLSRRRSLASLDASLALVEAVGGGDSPSYPTVTLDPLARARTGDGGSGDWRGQESALDKSLPWTRVCHCSLAWTRVCHCSLAWTRVCHWLGQESPTRVLGHASSLDTLLPLLTALDKSLRLPRQDKLRCASPVCREEESVQSASLPVCWLRDKCAYVCAMPLCQYAPALLPSSSSQTTSGTTLQVTTRTSRLA